MLALRSANKSGTPSPQWLPVWVKRLSEGDCGDKPFESVSSKLLVVTSKFRSLQSKNRIVFGKFKFALSILCVSLLVRWVDSAIDRLADRLANTIHGIAWRTVCVDALQQWDEFLCAPHIALIAFRESSAIYQPQSPPRRTVEHPHSKRLPAVDRRLGYPNRKLNVITSD